MVFEGRNVAGGDCETACSAGSCAARPGSPGSGRRPAGSTGRGRRVELFRKRPSSAAIARRLPARSADPPVVDGDFPAGATSTHRSCRPQNPDLVEQCPGTDKRIIRFVGDGQRRPKPSSSPAPASREGPRAHTLCGRRSVPVCLSTSGIERIESTRRCVTSFTLRVTSVRSCDRVAASRPSTVETDRARSDVPWLRRDRRRGSGDRRSR